MKKLFLRMNVLFLISSTLNATESQQTKSAYALARTLLQQPSINLSGHTDCEEKSAAFSPDGKYVVTTDSSTNATLWNAQTGELVKTLKGHRLLAISPQFSPDGTQLVTIAGSAFDSTIKVWDLEKGTVLYTLPGDTAYFSPDGKYIATSNWWEGKTKIWDAGPGSVWKTIMGRLVHTLEGQINYYYDDSPFSPDGKFIITNEGMSTTLWSTQTGQLVHAFHERGISFVTSAYFSPDGNYIVVTYNNGAHLWNAHTYVLVRSFEGNTVRSHGNYVVTTSSYEKTAQLWNTEKGKLVRTFTGHAYALKDAQFSPDGTKVFTVADNDTVKLWDVHTGKLLQHIEHKGTISPQFSSDSSRMITIPGDNETLAQIWNIHALIFANYFIDKKLSLKKQVLLVALDALSRHKNGANITKADLREISGGDLFLQVNPSVQQSLRSFYHLDNTIFARRLIQKTHDVPGFLIHRLHFLKIQAWA